MSENLEKRRKQLSFRSWHRGTREMDMILGSFADKHIKTMSEEELENYAIFLELSDPQLYNWYMGKEELPDTLKSPLMEKYLSHKVT